MHGRPRVRLEGSPASPEEAAAAVAAVEQFLRDTASSRAPAPADPWLRAARLEAVGFARDEPHPW